MENKYFTPDIEDLCIGYECEINNTYGKWESITITFTNSNSFYKTDLTEVCLLVEDKYVRVPYLTKEQIEAEGWKFDYNLGDFDYYIKKVNDKEEYELEFCYKERININIWKRTLYHGECKDINTFRKIIKLLNIN
jgi:hypothetical protein